MENNGVDNIIRQKLQNFEVDLDLTDWQFMEEMLESEESNIVDETAKEKLYHHEVPFDAMNWAAMDIALDDLVDIETVDEVVKSNLETFEVPYNVANWSIMGAMLDAEIPDETPDEIDVLAKAALASFSIPFVLSDWEMMDMELDELGFPNGTDEAARAALRNYETAMPSDWGAMETALSNAENLRRQLVITKSIEVLLFIFAIWTIGNFLPFKQESASVVINTNEQVEEINNQPQTNSDDIGAATIDVLETVDNEITTSNSTNDIEGIFINNTNNDSNDKSNSILNFIPDYGSTIPPSKEETVVNNTERPIANLNSLPLEEQLVTYPDGKGAAFGKKKPNQSVNQAIFLDTKQFALVVDEVLPNSTVGTNYKKDELRFRIAAAPQYAFITNDDNRNNRKIATGFSTNVGVDYAISDKVELSSGITYNRKSYLEQQQQEFTNAYNQFTLNSVKDVELEIIQIPVHVNYNIIKNDKTRLYATTGVTCGLIMKIDNNTQQVSLANSISNLGRQNVDVMYASTTESSNNEGALQNGEISTNTFITADLGVGLEYQVTPRLSFFIEPLFQQSLHKIGVEEEDYQNYAFSIGSRVVL